MKLVSRVRSVFRLGAAQVMVLVLLGALPVILALTAVTASMSPPKASAATPPSLAGETFSASTVTGSFTCTALRTGSATFAASGAATGPYPGTFTETGSATMTAGTLTLNVTNFTITSVPAGVFSVTGTKSFSGLTGTFDAVACEPGVDFAFVVGSSPPPAISYHATINSPLGTVTDSGDAQAQLCLCVPTNIFNEDFTRSNGVVAVCNEDSQGQNQNEQNDQIEDMNDQCGEGD